MTVMCLFGPDSSGESSLARTLARELERRGLSPVVVWMRDTHTFTFKPRSRKRY